MAKPLVPHLVPGVATPDELRPLERLLRQKGPMCVADARGVGDWRSNGVREAEKILRRSGFVVAKSPAFPAVPWVRLIGQQFSWESVEESQSRDRMARSGESVNQRTRRYLYEALSNGPRPSKEICENAPQLVRPNTLRKMADTLTARGFIVKRKIGKVAYWALAQHSHLLEDIGKPDSPPVHSSNQNGQMNKQSPKQSPERAQKRAPKQSPEQAPEQSPERVSKKSVRRLTQLETVRLADWLRANQSEIDKAQNAKEVIQLATKELEFDVPSSSLKSLADELKIKLPDKRISASPQNTSARKLRYVAKQLRRLYELLGEEPPEGLAQIQYGFVFDPED